MIKIDQIIKALKKRWMVTDLGPLHHINGIKVTRDCVTCAMHLLQPAYIDIVAAQFPSHLTRVAKSAPMDSCTPTNNTLVNTKVYQEIVGCLLWLANTTRPDICYLAEFLARFVATPTQSRLDQALRVVLYLVQSRNHGIALGNASA